MANDSHVLLRALADELARCGVELACTSPGSRSSPLVLALVREPGLRCVSHLDERVAGFFALGAAKQSRRPSVIACTSGTAGAHYLPAIIEAREARVPLIVLTADRPPELRDVGAGQTVDQVKLFGDAVKWFVEVGVDEASPARLRWMRTLACRAVWTALEGRPGPVHLNFPLREPLVADAELPVDGTGRAEGRPYVARGAGGDGAGSLSLTGRGVIVAGRDERDPALAGAVVDAAERLGWPLLADPLSGARRGGPAIAHYDALLRVAAFAEAHRPDVVLRVGDLPTSKPLRTWLASLDARQIALDPEGAWHDPDAVVDERVGGDPVGALRALAGNGGDEEWLGAWTAADRAAAQVIGAALGEGLSEPRVALELGNALPPDATLVVASSMPIRDVETFMPRRDDPPRVLSNRGANGIDGTVSTALGVAAAARRRTFLLTGDLALLYDAGALLSAHRLGLDLTIVVLNNDGGGIFHFLPIAGATDAFEEHVATPHGLDLGPIVTAFGASHSIVEDVAALRAGLERRDGGVHVLEVRTERDENVALHRRIWDAVAAAI